MPGLITDLANTGALKIAYPKKAVETMIQEDLVFRPRLKRGLPPGARISDGYEIHFGARLNPAQNVGMIADGGEFPTPKDAIDRQFIFYPRIFAADYTIGGMTRYAVNSDVAGFNGGEMQRRPEEAMGNLGKFIESTYVGTAGDGIRGYVESDGSNTFVVAQPHGTRLIAENQYLTVRIAAGSTVRDSLDLRTADAISHATRTVTYSGADQTAVAADPIYITPTLALSGATLAASANGLRGQVDDGTNALTIHGLTRSAAGNAKLSSLRLANGGERRNLTESLLLAAAHETARRSSKKPSTLLMGEGQCEKYIEHVAPQKRFPAVGRTRPGKSTGYTIEELSFVSPYGAMDFMLSFDCLPGEIYGLSWDAMFFYSKLDSQWLSGVEAQNLMLMPGTNAFKFAWSAYLVSIENWGTDYPLAHFVISDLKDRLLGD
jgi:hypothetical protein